MRFEESFLETNRKKSNTKLPTELHQVTAHDGMQYKAK
jgi:hypothetical protein